MVSIELFYLNTRNRNEKLSEKCHKDTESQHLLSFKKSLSLDKSHSLTQGHEPWFGHTICQLDLSWYIVDFYLLLCHKLPKNNEKMSYLLIIEI